MAHQVLQCIGGSLTEIQNVWIATWMAAYVSIGLKFFFPSHYKIQLEIWGKAQREYAQHHKSNWGKNSGW